MESFKNTLGVGAEKIAEEIQVNTQKEMSQVFDFIYNHSSQKEVYEWLRNLQFQSWNENMEEFYWDKRAYMNSYVFSEDWENYR